MSCLGLDLTDSSLFTEEKIFKIDTYDTMWQIY